MMPCFTALTFASSLLPLPRVTNASLLLLPHGCSYVLVGTYVGIATVGVFIHWYIAYDDGLHPLVSLSHLMGHENCHLEPGALGSFTREGFHWMDDAAYHAMVGNPCL